MTDTRTPVEVMARGIHAGEFARGETVRDWDQVPEHAARIYREEARDALAALAESPDVVERMARAIDDVDDYGLLPTRIRNNVATAALAALTEGADR